jgi:hypothetical protein
MRPFLAAPALGLLLLAGCAPTEHLLSERIDPAALAPPPGARAVSLHIGNGFTPDEQRTIVAAVRDLNQGPYRGVGIAVAPRTYNAPEPGSWTVVKANASELATTDRWQVHPVAQTRPLAGGGGVIVVDVNRLGPRDLRQEIAHELQFVLENEQPGRRPPLVSAR